MNGGQVGAGEYQAELWLPLLLCQREGDGLQWNVLPENRWPLPEFVFSCFTFSFIVSSLLRGETLEKGAHLSYLLTGEGSAVLLPTILRVKTILECLSVPLCSPMHSFARVVSASRSLAPSVSPPPPLLLFAPLLPN